MRARELLQRKDCGVARTVTLHIYRFLTAQYLQICSPPGEREKTPGGTGRQDRFEIDDPHTEGSRRAAMPKRSPTARQSQTPRRIGIVELMLTSIASPVCRARAVYLSRAVTQQSVAVRTFTGYPRGLDVKEVPRHGYSESSVYKIDEREDKNIRCTSEAVGGPNRYMSTPATRPQYGML